MIKKKRIEKVLFCALMTAAFTGAVFCLPESGAKDIVSADGIALPEKVSFSVETEPCLNGDDGFMRVRITNGSENENYLISMDGGKSFAGMNGRIAEFDDLSSGSCSVCVMTTAGKNTLSDITTVYIGENGDDSITISADSTPVTNYMDGSITLHIGSFDYEKEYEYSTDGGQSWKLMDKYCVVEEDVAPSVYQCVVRCDGEKSDVIEVPVNSRKSRGSGFIRTDYVLQKPELLTGCEVTSLTMLLNHIGFDVDKITMADKYLPKSSDYRTDPRKLFKGDPHSIHGFGCFSDVICETAENYLSEFDKDGVWNVRNITGCSLDDLFCCIDNGNPVVVWASGNMGRIGRGASWLLEDGSVYVWPANEHCLLLTGYDKSAGLVYFNDPLKGQVSYQISAFESKFTQLECNAVIIVKE